MSRKTILMLATSVLVAACAAPAEKGSPINLNFTDMKPLELNVGAVQVTSKAGPTELHNVNPGAALDRYARRRLDAVGGEGTLNFTINQASLTSMQSPTSAGWTDGFGFGAPTEYTMTMRVALDLTGRPTRPDMKAAFTLERKKTLPASVSLDQRDADLNRLSESMARDMDKAIERTLDKDMKIVVRPGAITFGTPAPLESGGAVTLPSPAVMAPAKAKPVTITGTTN